MSGSSLSIPFTNPLKNGMCIPVYGVSMALIAAWAPTWYICDGTNNTPDLRDMFVVGAKQDDAGIPKSNIEGSLNQSGGSLSQPPLSGPIPVNGRANTTDVAGDFTNGGNVTFVPPYFALVYVMYAGI